MPVDIRSIDVVVCTWNSNRHFFKTCLDSIKRNVPVHHFIVIDRQSSDGTLDAIRRTFPDAIIVSSSEELGWARKRGVELVDTPYFAFIDDDIEITNGWFGRVTSKLNVTVGAIHELDYMVDLPPEVEKWDGQILHTLGVKTEIPSGRFVDIRLDDQYSMRGLTNSALIMTELLTNWNPPKYLSSFEDWLIMRHILSQGFSWRMITDRTVKHHFTGGARYWCKKATWNIVGGRLTGFSSVPLGWYIYEALRQTPKAFIASLWLQEPRIFPYVIQLHASYIDSYLRWQEYVRPHRLGNK
jgi:glycosyltransferase involved in cell wall biosynthesis